MVPLSDQIKRSAKGILRRLFVALPFSVLGYVEESALFAQGKGWGGGTLADEVQAALSLLPEDVRQNPVVLDVGANIGEWTATFLKFAPGATVYSFEPSTAAFGVLAERFASDSRVRLFQTAVGDDIGTACLWSDSPGSSLGSLERRRLNHIGIDFDNSEEVPVLTLDSWLARYPVHPALLKIDVEGRELSVLRGSKLTLQSVAVVQFEFGGTHIDSRTYFQDFFYFFLELGFRIYRLSPKGLDEVERYREYDEVFITTNYFAQRI